MGSYSQSLRRYSPALRCPRPPFFALEPALRSLITVRVSQLNGCAFCIDLNSALALQHHLEPDKLAALPEFESSPLFSDREKAALSYAEMVTASDRQPTVTHFEQLRRYFNDEAIIELTGLVAFQNLSSQFNVALGIESQGFCPLASPPDSRSRPA